MKQRIRPPRLLFFISLALAVVVLLSVYFYSSNKLPAAIEINTSGQPTIGYAKAKVHLVVFEEPKCSNCREFTMEIYPKIKKEYIDTNKVIFTAIPVSFLPNSMPAAVALLCVFYGDALYPNHGLYYTYLDYIFEHQPDEMTDWATTEKMVEFGSKASKAINLSKLENCVEMERYRIQIEKNTNYGRSLMGGTITTPTLYVNGIKVENLTYPDVKKLIDQVIQNGGK